MATESEMSLSKSIFKYTPNSFDVWALGITVVIGGQYVGWNFALSAGFGSYIIAYFLMGSAYICHVNILAELASVLPFGGGSYAQTRSLIGFYAGFIIGCIEAMGYIIYTATSALFLSKILGEIFEAPRGTDTVFCLMFYLSAIAIYLQPRFVFWIANMVLGLTSLIVLLLFCLGNLKYVNFSQYARWSGDRVQSPGEQWFHDGGFEFMKIFHLCAWHFVGVESLNFTSQIVTNSTTIVPRGYMLSVITLFVTGTLVSFTVICTSPGIEVASSETFPLAFGLSRAYGLSYKAALAMMVPAIYATSFGFILGYAKIFQYMGASKLLPFSLSKTTSCGSPYLALLVGAFIGQIICIAEYFNSSLLNYSFNACILAAFVTYIAQCICYLQLKRKFPSVKPVYINPLGKFGVFYAIIVFSIGIISVIGFQKDNGIVVGTMIVTVALLSVYYCLYANAVQIFNEEEVKYTFNMLVRRRNKKFLRTLRKRKSLSNINQTAPTQSPSKENPSPITWLSRVPSFMSFKPSPEPPIDPSNVEGFIVTVIRNTENFRRDILGMSSMIRQSNSDRESVSKSSSRRTKTIKVAPIDDVNNNEVNPLNSNNQQSIIRALPLSMPLPISRRQSVDSQMSGASSGGALTMSAPGVSRRSSLAYQPVSGPMPTLFPGVMTSKPSGSVDYIPPGIPMRMSSIEETIDVNTNNASSKGQSSILRRSSNYHSNYDPSIGILKKPSFNTMPVGAFSLTRKPSAISDQSMTSPPSNRSTVSLKPHINGNSSSKKPSRKVSMEMQDIDEIEANDSDMLYRDLSNSGLGVMSTGQDNGIISLTDLNAGTFNNFRPFRPLNDTDLDDFRNKNNELV